MSTPRDLVRLSDFDGDRMQTEGNPQYEAFMYMVNAFGADRVSEMSHYSLFLAGRQFSANKERFYKFINETKAKLEEAASARKREALHSA